MKKRLAICLCVVLLVGILPACGSITNESTAEIPKPAESPEEAKVLKIMILGSSRSVNSFQLLWEVFKDQMPNQKVVLGIMYYSGCSMSMHVSFTANNEAVYSYYRNDNGSWNITKDVTMNFGLTDQAWDIVFLQAGNGDTENNMNETARKYLTTHVNEVLEHPHVFWWHSTWFNSTDPNLYADSRKSDASSIDPVAQLTATNDAAKNYVMDDPMFAGHITSGTPMMYALKIEGLQDKDLFRDHTHLSDYGCLLVAYAFYAQLTGNAVSEIGIDTIPSYLRHSSTQDLGDMPVTDEMKQIILNTVDYTMTNPWSVPGAAQNSHFYEIVRELFR